ncbi:hypothetical protein PR003_g17316 [Phytophthora rubi]|uniref:Uncharacterized protein n=2 Tax=Phytophthora rubi TaxID=129364 RepID=A0A6A4EGK8_9STRA|nr:hypothetical protein PR002_g23835 [Phytophthora rubi]KAE9322077.1 hypothetical protein PR003_g17316 [Phytophthora rubi]
MISNFRLLKMLKASPALSPAVPRFRLLYMPKTEAEVSLRAELHRADDVKADHRKAGIIADGFDVSTALDAPDRGGAIAQHEQDRADDVNAGTVRSALSPI